MNDRAVPFPRFIIRPAALIPGRYSVVDTVTDMIARKPGNGRTLSGLTENDAQAAADRANRRVIARKICRACRHKRLAVDMVEGRCPGCRRPNP